MRKKPIASTVTNNNLSRPSLIDTMLLTSTPLRRSPAVQSVTNSTRSATNLTLQQIFKEKNQTYEDMQLLHLTKTMNKKDKQNDKKSTSTNKNIKNRSKHRRTVVNQDEDDETENDEEFKIRNKPNANKRKTIVARSEPSEEPISKKLRRTAASNNKKNTKKPIGKISLIVCLIKN